MSVLSYKTPLADEPGPTRPGFLRRVRAWWGVHPVLQLALVALLVLGIFQLAGNFAHSMQRLGLSPGFAFLGHAANFEIGESLISYAAGDSYLRAIGVGLLNTLQVALVGCVLATVLGVILGVARLSSNPLLSGFVQVYIEIIRNTPLLLQLFFWNSTLHALPGPRQALSPLPGVFLSNRGVFYPDLVVADQNGALLVLFALLLAAFLVIRLFRTPQGAGGKTIVGLLAAAALAGLGFYWNGLALDAPRLQGFNLVGGRTISPEFAVIVIGLVVNAAASIAETVRAGIQSVPRGQWEAARALGLSSGRIIRLIVLPQALRVIVPVMTSSYLSLTKNSSLAVAIGFPDLVSVVNTSANVTGQALEAIAIMMGVYLSISLTISAGMNAYNGRWRKTERTS